MAGKKPNFILFITDQHRGDWLSCAGHPVVKTPHIDAIAKRGTRFAQFHVASQVCMPNRASLLTGRFPSVHGLRSNGALLPRSANTFVDVLAAGGYRTASIGKSHLQPMTGTKRPGPRPDTGPIAEAWKDDGEDYLTEDPTRFADDASGEVDLPYYGYQTVIAANEHGDRCGGHYGRWFRRQANDWRALHDDANELPHDYTCPQVYRTPVPEELYPTAFIRDRAIDYLSERAGEDDPFFLFVSFPDPHHPFNPPGRYWDMYRPEQFEVMLPYQAHRNPTPPLQFLDRQRREGATPLTAQTAFMADDRQLREAMALTAGMITMVDDAIGSVIASVRELGLDNDTVIAFTSDHGDYLGDFSMLLKGSPPFRSVTNVAFLWSDPKDPTPRVTDALGSTVDIGATILDRAGLKPYNGMQGRSLAAAIAGGTGPRAHLFSEYNDGAARLGFPTPPLVRSLITLTHRLTVYLGEDWGELYDLVADPHETCNLWDEPEQAALKAALVLQLTHELIDQMDRSPAPVYVA